MRYRNYIILYKSVCNIAREQIFERFSSDAKSDFHILRVQSVGIVFVCRQIFEVDLYFSQ